MIALREFIGNADLGWKVAQCNRSTFMYGAILLGAMVFGFLRQRRIIQPLHLLPCAALMLPMIIDGTTHFISEIRGGMAGGFRSTNQWLADQTAHALPTSFYIGDTLGSFNLWARFISSLLFGLAVVWLVFPHLNQSLVEAVSDLRAKLTQPAEYDAIAVRIVEL